MSSSFGRGHNQAPLNQFLGKLAFRDFVTPVPVAIASNYTITPVDIGTAVIAKHYALAYLMKG